MMSIYSSLSLKCQSVMGRALDQGFSNLGTVGLLDQIVLCQRDCSVHRRMLSSIPGLYPLDTEYLLSSYHTQKCLYPLHCQISPGGGRTTAPAPESQGAWPPESEGNSGDKVHHTPEANSWLQDTLSRCSLDSLTFLQLIQIHARA